MQGAYHHVQGIQGLEARNHGGYEGVARHFGENVALIAHMFDLLEANH